jgi:hypothetical protein
VDTLFPWQRENTITEETFSVGLCRDNIIRNIQLRVRVVTCEKLVQFGNPEQGERPPLEAVTEQQLVKTEKTLRVL